MIYCLFTLYNYNLFIMHIKRTKILPFLKDYSHRLLNIIKTGNRKIQLIYNFKQFSRCKQSLLIKNLWNKPHKSINLSQSVTLKNLLSLISPLLIIFKTNLSFFLWLQFRRKISVFLCHSS